jgi:hypothetical protein
MMLRVDIFNQEMDYTRSKGKTTSRQFLILATENLIFSSTSYSKVSSPTSRGNGVRLLSGEREIFDTVVEGYLNNLVL